LTELAAGGVSASQVSLIVQTGADMSDTGIVRHPHRAEDRGSLSYLASTKGGRRIYLNRTVVEADQAIVVAEVRFNFRGEVIGGATSLFPALSDAAAIDELVGEPVEKLRNQANEVAWLLGAPFFLHIIRGAGGRIARVVGGLADSFITARAACETEWRAEVKERADVVIAELGRNNVTLTADDFAAAAANAGRIARPGGTIALVSGAAPVLGSAWQSLRGTDSITVARAAIRKMKAPDGPSAKTWLRAVGEFRVLVLSGWPAPMVEELFATPVADFSQQQRVVDASVRVAVLNDAERTHPDVQEV